MDERRKFTVSKHLFLQLLELGSITFEDLRTKFGTNAFDGKDHGSAVIFAEGTEVYATVWIGVNNVSLMVNKEEIKSFKFLI
jgi:hypothetical protein